MCIRDSPRSASTMLRLAPVRPHTRPHSCAWSTRATRANARSCLPRSRAAQVLLFARLCYAAYGRACVRTAR
eukprot:4475800-Alexandrium_andersonii.AAC.1